MTPEYLWNFLFIGYLHTIAVETPVLLLGLSPGHSLKRKLAAALWLTACTYPIVVLVFPIVLDFTAHKWRYIIVAEIFAPAAECLLFWLAFHHGGSEPRTSVRRDMIAVLLANLASFGVGELLHAYGIL